MHTPNGDLRCWWNIQWGEGPWTKMPAPCDIKATTLCVSVSMHLHGYLKGRDWHQVDPLLFSTFEMGSCTKLDTLAGQQAPGILQSLFLALGLHACTAESDFFMWVSRDKHRSTFIVSCTLPTESCVQWQTPTLYTGTAWATKLPVPTHFFPLGSALLVLNKLFLFRLVSIWSRSNSLFWNIKTWNPSSSAHWAPISTNIRLIAWFQQ